MEGNIYDYLDYYKDYSFDEVNFNMMDALLYSIISYVPIDNMNDDCSIKTLNNITSTIITKGTMPNAAIEIIKRMTDSVRYSGVRLYYLVKDYNDKYEFGALTFRDKNYTFIGFQGSVGTIVGWKENLYIMVDYPTASQSRASKYLHDVIKFTDRKIYLGGHSKGGNLALTTLMLANKSITKRIIKAYNFDGPGFKIEEFESDRYKEVKDKMVNILPDGSMIGIILNHDKYNFIKSKNVSIEKHFPTNWQVFGEFFVKSEENRSSKALNERISISLDKLSPEERRLFVDTLFDIMNNKKINKVRDFSKLDLNDIKEITSKMKNLSSEKRKIVTDTFKMFLINK